MITSRIYQAVIVVLLCTSVAGWGCAITRGASKETAKADTKVCQAEVRTITQTVVDTEAQKAQLVAIQNECAAEGLRLRRENDAAVKRAFEAGRNARDTAADFNRRVANPPTDQCQAFVRSTICPELMDY